LVHRSTRGAEPASGTNQSARDIKLHNRANLLIIGTLLSEKNGL